MGVFSTATVFAWVSPILPHLLSPDSEVIMTPEEASWMTAMPEIGNLISPLPAGLAADYFGRKPIILLSAPLLLVGWSFILYFKTLLAWNIGRFIQGLAIGMIYTAVPLYLGEVASPRYRGAVASTFFCSYWAGFLFEYILGPYLSVTVLTYVTASVNIVFFVVFLFQPESPYYYLIVGNLDKAQESLSWFMNSSQEGLKELERIRLGDEGTKKTKASWYEVVATSTDRKALGILFLVGFLRQLCGIIPVSIYSTETLKSEDSSFFLSADDTSFVMGIFLVVGAICSTFTMDIFGRRTLLFISCTISGVCMFCAGTYYLLNTLYPQSMLSWNWIPPISFIVLSGVSVLGIFPVNIAYASELFTNQTRGAASSLFSIWTTILGLLVIKYYITLNNVVGVYINFYVYSAVCFVGMIVSFCVMPETKGKTFEAIREELQGVSK